MKIDENKNNDNCVKKIKLIDHVLNVNNGLIVEGAKVQGVYVEVTVDTGANISLIGNKFYRNYVNTPLRNTMVYV